MNFSNDWIFINNGKPEAINLPHDAMIDSERSKHANGGGANAYFDGGIYEYQKTFNAPLAWEDKFVSFEFEGVYRNAKVYINDILAGEQSYGYTGFYICADNFLNYGKLNTIKVIADNSQTPNSRWYSGGGIYRCVNLIVKNKIHFDINGITVTTTSINPAIINVVAKTSGGKAEYKIFDGKTIVATIKGDSGEILLPDAKLWSDDSPNLYKIVASLYNDDKLEDEESFDFGVRTIKWSNNGFFVNGKKTLLRGGCIHHDNGILGACCYSEAEDRRVRIVKEAGYNALRSSHNPCSKAMLSACDKYGIFMIDETWDMWYIHKKKYDYATDFLQNYKHDIKAMVQKDKNHASVIMYSLANEPTEPYEQKGINLMNEMSSYIRSLDNTRAITAGINSFIISNAKKGKGIYREEVVMADNSMLLPKKEKPTSSTLFNMIAVQVGSTINKAGVSDEVDGYVSPCLTALDIVGYNYGSGRYSIEGKKHPERIIFGSETYPQDIYKNWEMVKKFPYLIGDFMWTAWDYLGEVGLGGWSYETLYGFTFEKPYPWIIADTGAIDIIGTIGAEAKYASTVWGLEKAPYIGVIPVNHPKSKLLKSVWRGTNAINSWSWNNCEGNNAKVEVYSDCAYIALYFNDKRIAIKKVKQCKAVFSTKYFAGTLKAIALDKNKKEIAQSVLKSAQKEIEIALHPEKKLVGINEVVFVSIDISDTNGIIESNCDCTLSISVENGSLLAFGSASQKTEEKYSSNICQTYYGRALAVVKADKKGELKITVKGEKLKSQTALIFVES